VELLLVELPLLLVVASVPEAELELSDEELA
jgi:hypothetical protein